MPTATGTYTLPAGGVRFPPARLSRQVNPVWPFDSEQVARPEAEELPLLAVRYRPELDDHERPRASVSWTEARAMSE